MAEANYTTTSTGLPAGVEASERKANEAQTRPVIGGQHRVDVGETGIVGDIYQHADEELFVDGELVSTTVTTPEKQVALPAVAAVVKKQLRRVDVTFSLDTSPDANDVAADTQVITDALSRPGGVGKVIHWTLRDEDDQGVPCRVVFLRSNVSVGTEDAAVSITDANAREITHVLSIIAADYTDLINSQQVHGTGDSANFMVETVAGSRDIYVALVNGSSTPTYSASGVRLTLWIEEV